MFTPKLKAFVIEERLLGNVPTPEEVNYYSTTETDEQCARCIFFNRVTSHCSLLDMEVLPEATCDVFIETNKHDAITLLKEKLQSTINPDNGFPILTAVYGSDDFDWEDVSKEGIYPFEYAFSDSSSYHIPICRLGEDERERFSLTAETLIGTDIPLPYIVLNKSSSSKSELGMSSTISSSISSEASTGTITETNTEGQLEDITIDSIPKDISKDKAEEVSKSKDNREENIEIKQLETIYLNDQVVFTAIPKDWNIDLKAKYSILKGDKVYLSKVPESEYPTIAWEFKSNT